MSKKAKIFSLIIVVLVIAASGAVILLSSKKTPKYVTSPVIKGTLTQSVGGTGKVESIDRIELNFKTTGRISSLPIKIGDKVKAGQLLGSLEAGALQSQVKDAQAKLDQAQADYDKLLAGSSAEDIRVAQDTVSQRQQDVLAAENNLDSIKQKRDTELVNLKDTAVVALNNELPVGRNAMQEIDNTFTDSDAKNTLSIKNKNALSSAQIKQTDANLALDTAQTTISQISTAAADRQVISALDEMKLALQKTADALSTVVEVLGATTISTDLTDAELDTLKDNISAQQTKINTSRTNIQTAKSNWTNAVASYNDKLASSLDAIDQAKTAAQVAQSQLAAKKSPPRQFEIDSQLAKVNQAKASLVLANANLSEVVIRAPLAGTITKKNFQPGEQSSLSEPVLEMIGQSNLQIEVNIPESDIASLASAQTAEITLDAFSDERKFAGTVIFVDPAETIIQDVVYYKVKIQLNEQYQDIKPGMTANITIYINRKDDVLYVPARAIKNSDSNKYVEVLTLDNQIIRKDVAIGMRGDEGAEIVTGLDEGEMVITFVKNGE